MKVYATISFSLRVLSLLPVGLLIYALVWGTLYRLPRMESTIIDTRDNAASKPYYVVFCGSLASNPHGFPGHCYIAWSETQCDDVACMECRGYVPARSADQIPSLIRTVPGLVVKHASSGNMRNLTKLIVITDKARYAATKHAASTWDARNFKVGEFDCVAYADSIAERLKIHRPDHHFKFPQDYVTELQRLNPPN